MEDSSSPRLYSDLARWWPLMSPPSHYEEEAEDLLPLLLDGLPPDREATLLELGSGGGSLAWHLREHFKLTLTDRSKDMLAVNRAVNPEAEHIAGDMRTLELGRTFDRVLIHDAIMYAVDPASVLATLRTAAKHCAKDGKVLVIPDAVRETFEPSTGHGGEDGTDGSAFRYLEWSWDPDPSDDTIEVVYAYVMRDADGVVRTVHDHHREGCFSRKRWLHWFHEAGLFATSWIDRWNRDIFVAIPSDQPPLEEQEPQPLHADGKIEEAARGPRGSGRPPESEYGDLD